jgi:hypothetical protein
MHGPCDPIWQACPRFGPNIRVVDDVAKTVRAGFRRLIWRTARDRALALWAAAGISFAVEEGPGESYDFLNSADDLAVLVIPNTIRIVRNVANRPPDTYAPEDFAWWDGGKDGSVAVYTPHSVWWKRYWLPALVGLVCHELGHCLGLWHRTDHGVMAGGAKPDDHDLESIRSYYA